MRTHFTIQLLAVLGLCAASLTLFAHDAEAFVRTLTCTESGIYACADGEEAKAVYWPALCVNYHINTTGTEDLEYSVSTDEIVAGFTAWNEASCSNFAMNFAGETDEDRIGYNPTTGREGNANVMVFRDTGWSHSQSVLALTSVTFQSTSGEIFDADIEFNSQRYTFTATDNPIAVQIDLKNTITHEAGHFLGLDHSAEPAATMFSTAPLGETAKRSLEQDDIDGICAIYSDTTPLPEGSLCAGGPTGFFERPEAGPEDQIPADTRVTRCGCKVSAPASSFSFSGLALFVLCVGGLFIRRQGAASRDASC